MTLYAVILFLHLLGVLFLYMSFAIEWVILGRVRSSTTLEQARPWLSAAGSVPKLAGIGGILIVLPGVYLATVAKFWHQAWVQAALTTVIVMVVLGAAIARPRLRALDREAMSGGPTTPDTLRRLRDSIPLNSLRLRVTLGLGVLYLMAAKPGLVPTLITMGVALVLGIVMSGAAKK